MHFLSGMLLFINLLKGMSMKLFISAARVLGEWLSLWVGQPCTRPNSGCYSSLVSLACIHTEHVIFSPYYTYR